MVKKISTKSMFVFSASIKRYKKLGKTIQIVESKGKYEAWVY